MQPRAPRRIVMLAYDGANLIDLGGPMQAFATAGRVAMERGAAAHPYALTIASAAGGAVRSGAELPVLTQAVNEIAGGEIDTLLVPGGSVDGEIVVVPELVAWIQANAPRIRRICSVCSGAFVLAATGLLDGRRVTTHWDWAERLRRRHPLVQVDADPIFLQDDPVWTSAGVTAGIDLALALIEQDLGHGIAIQTARQLVVFLQRPGGQSQYSVPLAAQSSGSADFASLHGWMAANLDRDLRVERLAAQVGMSPRNFARIYAARVGCTPAKTVEAMRFEAAQRALESSAFAIKRVATMVGYGDETTMRRVFQRRLGIAPAEYRERFAVREFS